MPERRAMLFSSVSFIYVFLPATLALYHLAGRRSVALRNAVLLAASLIFYFSGEPKYTLLLVFSSLVDYFNGLAISRWQGTRRAKLALACSIVVNLALLGFFKYADFITQTLNSLLGTSIPALDLPLPIGISFYTFQTMSYAIDVYRGDARAQKSLPTFAAYVSMFPQLVAGPIVRYSQVADELASDRRSVSKFASGVGRFAVGLGKKVLIANVAGELVSKLAQDSALGCWLTVAAFTLQIYYDFSGYSDMAIGLGRMLGFDFPENFNYPFISKSITEFWRRWHITLGAWFRDYVYIPMGGNRVSKPRWLVNILTVWLLTGLWHGASWNFALWGLFFGVLLAGEKLIWGKRLAKRPALGHILTLLAVLISFAIFYSDTPALAAKLIPGMFGGAPLWDTASAFYLRSYAVVLVVAMIGSTPLVSRVCHAALDRSRWLEWLKPAWYALLLIVCTAYLVDGSFNPFLYFRF